MTMPQGSVMAASDNIDLSKSSWPKWLLALLIGAPVTVGIGFYYFKRKKSIEDINVGKNGTVKVKGSQNEIPVNKANADQTDKTSKEQLVLQSPLDKALNLKNSGNDFFKKSRYDEALRCYSEAISICPREECLPLATIYQNRGAVHEVMRNYEGVLEDCGRAIELNPKYAKALSRRVKAAEKLDQLRVALEDVTALCILEKFDNVNTLNNADRILKKLGVELAKEAVKTRVPIAPSKFFITTYLKSFVNDPITKEEFPPELCRPKEALENGHLEEACNLCTEHLEGLKLAEERGAGEERIGEVEISLERGKYLCLLIRATALLLIGKTPQALQDLSLIIDSNPPLPKIVVNALVKRGSLHLQLDELEECMEDFSKAEKIDPTNSDIFQQRAQVHLYSEKLDEAWEDYEKVVNLSPEFGLGALQRMYTKYRKAALTREAEGMAEATAQLAAAAERRPDVPEGFLLLGQVQADQQNFDAACKAFDRVRKENPQNANVLVHKGLLELQWHGDVDKAVEYLEEAIRIDGKCEFAYETLASIEVQRGNLARAVELFSKALTLAKGEKEMSHILSLKCAAEAQQVVAKRLGLVNGIGINY